MLLAEFSYNLANSLIAQEPSSQRDASRLMVLDRKTRRIIEKSFCDIIDYIESGDCLVLNNTRVVPSRLYARRKTGAKVEIFLLNPLHHSILPTPYSLLHTSPPFEALIRPSKRIKPGEILELENGIEVQVAGSKTPTRSVQFNAPLDKVLAVGHTPLPPYITREDALSDKDRYQTVYAAKDGATASPTAGLHFTENLLEKIKAKGVSIAYITLHISYGTFQPVKSEKIEEHIMHSEYFEVNDETAHIINQTKSLKGRIFAVGTSSVRTLEGACTKEGKIAPSRGITNLFIYPGYKFKMVDSMITNFHLPESTLLMLTSAFAGKDFLFRAYEEATSKKYRFYSYGDAMLIV